jgi:hypothetical protein
MTGMIDSDAAQVALVLGRDRDAFRVLVESQSRRRLCEGEQWFPGLRAHRIAAELGWMIDCVFSSSSRWESRTHCGSRQE